MKQTEENFFAEHSIFDYKNRKCRCEIDTIHKDPFGNPEYTVKVVSEKNGEAEFAFTAGKGLFRKKSDELAKEEDVLGKLLNLEGSDSEELKRFFGENGFLFPIPDDEYTKIKLDDLIDITRRIKATIGLFNAISQHDWKLMLENSAYLAFSKPIEINVSGNVYSFKNDPFSNVYENAGQYNAEDRSRETFNQGHVEITDTTYAGKFTISKSDYAELMEMGNGLQSIPGSESDIFRRLTNLYFSRNAGIDEKIRGVIDFFFRWQYEYGVFRPFDGMEIKCYDDRELPDKVENDELAEALEKTAKRILENEINTNIAGITPKYNCEKTSPEWTVNSLIQAVYFSIFYLKPGIQCFRKCENPNCRNNGYFIVNVSCGNKKFCSPRCRNAYNSMMNRKRLKGL